MKNDKSALFWASVGNSTKQVHFIFREKKCWDELLVRVKISTAANTFTARDLTGYLTGVDNVWKYAFHKEKFG